MNIDITRADVREFVEATAKAVEVDAVVSDLDAHLRLVGKHPITTALNPTTVQLWIALRVRDDLSVDSYRAILQSRAY